MILRTIYLLILPVAFTYSCKSAQNVAAEPIELILLLEEQVEPNDIAALEGIVIINQKRTSRSQNQWMVKLEISEEEINELKDELSKDLQVISVISAEKSENENITNN